MVNNFCFKYLFLVCIICTDILFQVFQSDTYNFHRFIWPIKGTQTRTMTPNPSEPGSNDFKGVTLHSPMF